MLFSVEYVQTILSCKPFLIFLNKRDFLNKWQQRESTGDVCMYDFTTGVKFCGEYFRGKYFWRELALRIIKKKPAKIAKIRTRKNLVPLCNTEQAESVF